MAKKGLKVTSQTKTGLNDKFRDAKGNKFTLNQFRDSESLRSTYGVHLRKRGSTTYIASNPDGKKNNNLEK